MANYFHVALLQLHTGAWNQWVKRIGSRANLRSANLSGTTLSGANLHEANLHKADLSEADLSEANLYGANLYGADLRRANLYKADLSEADLSEAGLSASDRRLLAENDYPFILNVIFQPTSREMNLREAILRETNLQKADFRETNLQKANLHKANLHKANLSKVVFCGADLSEANLKGANLRNTNLSEANLKGANLRNTNLSKANLSGADLRNTNLSEANLSGADLSGVVLNEANLSRANLNGVDLSGSFLRQANLSEANLSTIQALGTILESAILTGACIQDWNINSDTDLRNLICEYIFLKYDFEKSEYSDRRPHDPDKTFANGDFVKLVQKARNTVELIFRNGINWVAFAHSVHRLQVTAGTTDLFIQAIENKDNGDFVIRVNTPTLNVNKAEIQRFLEQEYQCSLQSVEDKYRYQLQTKDEQIEIYRQQSTNLTEIIKLMAGKTTYDFRNAQFDGGFINAETVQSHQIGGDIYNTDN